MHAAMELCGFSKTTSPIVWRIWIPVLFLAVKIAGYVNPESSSSHVKHASYCSDYPIGRLTLACSPGSMVHIDDSVIFARDDTNVRLKALGNHQSCDYARSCSITFQTYHSGWNWLNCLNITYSCLSALCRNLPQPVFGAVSVATYALGGNAKYRCDHGYMLNGAVTTTCMSYDNRYSWYPQPPTCEYNCRNLVLSPHPVGAYMSMCYEFVLVKKSWDEARGYCTRNNGMLITYESMDFFETAFDAKPGIKLAGTSTWGTFWTSSEEYRPRYCKILNVNVMKTVDHYTRWMNCDRKYFFICEYEPVHPKRCGPLPVPENGAKSFSNESIGTVVSFTCNTGYTINGTDTRKCLSSGMWSGQEPRCVEVDCGKPDITNGSKPVVVSFSHTTYLSFANYSCGSGHVLFGDAVRLCIGNGTWSGRAPECRVIPRSTNTPVPTTTPTTTVAVIDCGKPVPGNATEIMKVEFNSTLLSSLATFWCIDEGNTLEGDAVHICTENATWNGTTPFCYAVGKSEFAGYTIKNLDSPSLPSVVVVILVATVMSIILAVIIISVVLYKRGKFTVFCFHRTKGYPTESLNNPTYMEVDRNGEANVDLSYSVLTENEETIYEEIPFDRTL